ncbi:hypothetical protein [Bradyrhizobium sp.]
MSPSSNFSASVALPTQSTSKSSLSTRRSASCERTSSSTTRMVP